MIRIFMIGMSRNKGGVESYIQNLCQELRPEKFEIIYSAPDIELEGTVWNPPANRHNFLKYYTFWMSFYRANHFDAVYYNTCDVVSIDQLRFAKASGVPVRIIHSHNTGNQQGINRRMSLFHRLSEKCSRKVLDKYATHFLACSQGAGEWMFDGIPFKVIRNGISLPKYRYNEKSRKAIQDTLHIQNEKLIGVIGRLAPQKNPLFTVEVLKKVLKNHKDYSAVFVGDGELRTETEEAVRAAGLQDQVHFVGTVDNVNEWMSAVDCLLMPSLFEGLPFVLVEAQAAGLPCVVSSAVSEEANISGELRYVGLDEPQESWEEAIVQAANGLRYDAEKKLIEAGYSIEDSAKVVEKLISDTYIKGRRSGWLK